GPHRNIRRAAHDGVVGVDAEWSKEGVHGAAHALVEARLPAEDLRQRAIQEEINSQTLYGRWAMDDGRSILRPHRRPSIVYRRLNNFKGQPVVVALHNGHEGVVVQ